MTRPRILDLFCCQGGASRGYDLAGFDVYGIDAEPQPRYPYPFRQQNVLELRAKWIRKRFHAVHASPPCQFHTTLSALNPGHGHLNLIPQTRKLLRKTGLPYIIENVMGAKDHLIDPIMLCGTEFFLGAADRQGNDRELRRHRLFESNVPLSRKFDCYHELPVVGVYGNSGMALDGSGRGYKGTTEEASEAMEIDWMTHKGMSQAIPPAYTEHLGKQLIQYV